MTAELVDTCKACGETGPITMVLHRERFSNGHRARTDKSALCTPCARILADRYVLAPDDAAGYFVEGWHALSVHALAVEGLL